jgi:Rrf2 family iron-sulfur cluster assembly transcriptional regulator
VQLKDIARRAELSKGYLEHLAAALRNASLLRGISGPRGGYVLAKEPDDILIIEIIEAAIGPISVSSCVTSPEACVRSDSCECILLWKLLNIRIRDLLGEFSLKELTEKSWRDRIESAIEDRLAEGGGAHTPKPSGAWPCQQPARK